MPRDPNIPDAFDVYTVVILRRPADAPELPDEELDALQARHLAYRAELSRQGVLVVNGPFDEQSDLSYRGMSVFACDVSEARLKRAAERFRSAGLHNIQTRLLASERDKWVKRHKLGFDRVLVDAPCSGTGTWRRNPDARWRAQATGLDALVKLQADILRVPVIRPVVAETTALGAAYAAGLAVGFWGSLDELRQQWQEDRRWEPQMEQEARDRTYRNWKKAVQKTLDWVDDDVD